MQKFHAVMALALATNLVACKGSEEGDTADTATCDNAIVGTFPANNEAAAYYRTAIEVEFDEAETDATVTIDGVTGSGAWVEDTYVFTPDAPLAPATTYTVDIDYSCGSTSTSFTTSAVGAAVTGTLEGASYTLDLTSGRFIQPEGVGSLLQDFLTQSVLIGVNKVDDANKKIQMIGAMGDTTSSGDVAQLACEPSIPFPEADFSSNPFFSVGPENTTISVAGFSVSIDQLLIEGAMAPDASYIQGAILSGTIDTRPLVPLLNEGCDDPSSANYPCDDNAICAVAASINVQCEDCGGGENFCLSLLVDSIAADGYKDDSGAFIPVKEQHSPADSSPSATSTSYCVNPACSSLPECAG